MYFGSKTETATVLGACAIIEATATQDDES
jgi:hypothetical protein